MLKFSLKQDSYKPYVFYKSICCLQYRLLSRAMPKSWIHEVLFQLSIRYKEGNYNAKSNVQSRMLPYIVILAINASFIPVNKLYNVSS